MYKIAKIVAATDKKGSIESFLAKKTHKMIKIVADAGNHGVTNPLI